MNSPSFTIESTDNGGIDEVLGQWIHTRRREGHQYEGLHCENNSFIDNDASKGTLAEDRGSI